MTDKPRVVVLGAGPAGMSAAWRLSELGYPVTVLERDDAVGGMGRTITVVRPLRRSTSVRTRSTSARPTRAATS